MRKLALPFLFALLMVSCYKDNVPSPSSNASGLYEFKTLGGTTWVLTSYHDTVSSAMVYPNDTLVFVDSNTFTYNGIVCSYQYYFYHNSMQTHLELYGTPFGDMSAIVSPTIETYGVINGAKFSSYTGGQWYMWFERQ